MMKIKMILKCLLVSLRIHQNSKVKAKLFILENSVCMEVYYSDDDENES